MKIVTTSESTNRVQEAAHLSPRKAINQADPSTEGRLKKERTWLLGSLVVLIVYLVVGTAATFAGYSSTIFTLGIIYALVLFISLLLSFLAIQIRISFLALSLWFSIFVLSTNIVFLIISVGSTFIEYSLLKLVASGYLFGGFFLLSIYVRSIKSYNSMYGLVLSQYSKVIVF